MEYLVLKQTEDLCNYYAYIYISNNNCIISYYQYNVHVEAQEGMHAIRNKWYKVKHLIQVIIGM